MKKLAIAVALVVGCGGGNSAPDAATSGPHVTVDGDTCYEAWVGHANIYLFPEYPEACDIACAVGPAPMPLEPTGICAELPAEAHQNIVEFEGVRGYCTIKAGAPRVVFTPCDSV